MKRLMTRALGAVVVCVLMMTPLSRAVAAPAPAPAPAPASAPQVKYVGIPRVADPPPAINGSLERVSQLPGWRTIQGKAAMVFGPDHWTGNEDLSAQAGLWWRSDDLYVAARVKDQTVVQPYTGGNLWKGDHVILMLDAPRQSGVQDRGKVVQIGLSPGNLQEGTQKIPPEVYQWTPQARSVPGARVAARRTADGYQIEAAIPWAALGIEHPAEGLRIGFDILPSDADNPADPNQETIGSLLTAKWSLRDPNRLVEGVLAGSDGKVDPSWIKSSFEMVKSDLTIQPKSSVKVEIPDKYNDQAIQELVIRARIENKRVAGGNVMLQVRLNGQTLKFDRIRNRLKRIDMGSRQIASFSGGGANWFIFYAPDFKPFPAFSTYATPGIDPYELRFDVRDLWKKGGPNVVQLIDTSTLAKPIIAQVGVSEALTPKMQPPKLKPAPTGPIPTIVPITSARPDYAWTLLPGGAVEVKLGDQAWTVESQFSTTTPGWATLGREKGSEWTSFKADQNELAAAAKDFKLQRTITRHEDHLQVVDAITNTSDADLPVMFAHQVQVDRKDGTLYIAGRQVTLAKLGSNDGARPTVWFGQKKIALGLVAEDDISRAQGEEFANGQTVGIRDHYLVVGKGKTITLEYSIYPLETPQRFAFINRIRRNWGVNFTIPGSNTMISSYAPAINNQTPDAQLQAYFKNKSAHFAIGVIWDYVWGNPKPIYKPSHTHSREGRQVIFDRIKKLCPDVVRLIYYHCYLGWQERNPAYKPYVEKMKQQFKADAILRPDGTQADYSNPMMPLFLPTIGSPWGQAQAKQIDHLLKVTGADGLYWDEIPYSAYKYDYNPDHWDGVSARIDPKTHKILRKVTNVTLASQPWRLKMARHVMEKYPLVGNTCPNTRSFTQLHFIRFVETGSFSNIINCQLYTPIALGDNLTERSEADSYRDMVKGLDYGTVYYWYAPNIRATHPTLTSHMFPITPINLGPGYIIGQERILTNTSGYFGWRDDSAFKTVVFDERGNPTDKVKIPRVEKDGKAFAEVRIPQGYSVAIVRQ